MRAHDRRPFAAIPGFAAQIGGPLPSPVLPGLINPVKAAQLGWVAWFGLAPLMFFLAPPVFVGLFSQPADADPTGRGGRKR